MSNQRDLFDTMANEVQAKVQTEVQEVKSFFEKPVARYMVMAFVVLVLGAVIFTVLA